MVFAFGMHISGTVQHSGLFRSSIKKDCVYLCTAYFQFGGESCYEPNTRGRHRNLDLCSSMRMITYCYVIILCLKLTSRRCYVTVRRKLEQKLMLNKSGQWLVYRRNSRFSLSMLRGLASNWFPCLRSSELSWPTWALRFPTNTTMSLRDILRSLWSWRLTVSSLQLAGVQKRTTNSQRLPSRPF